MSGELWKLQVSHLWAPLSGFLMKSWQLCRPWAWWWLRHTLKPLQMTRSGWCETSRCMTDVGDCWTFLGATGSGLTHLKRPAEAIPYYAPFACIYSFLPSASGVKGEIKCSQLDSLFRLQVKRFSSGESFSPCSSFFFLFTCVQSVLLALSVPFSSVYIPACLPLPS